MLKTFNILLTLSLLVLLARCGDEDIDRRYTDYRTDIVTYVGADAGSARFELLRRDDSTAVTLLSDVTLPSQFKAGNRVLLRYDWADNVRSDTRRIVAYGVSAIFSDSLRYTVKPLSDYLSQMEPVKLLSIWRTGDYINLRCQAEYTGKPRQFYLLMDSTTWHRDTVHCYLVNNTLGDTTYHWRDAYASFHVGNIWGKPSCRALAIHINDANNPQKKEHYFIKQQ